MRQSSQSPEARGFFGTASTTTMAIPQNIFLVGPMGAGKTTIGKTLAELLFKDFYDSDREIEAATGADIPWIFDVEGEAGFRDREQRMIDSLTSRKNIVLATGGGAILVRETRSRLQARGFVIYLQVSIAQQVERTSRDRNRPLLQTDNPEQTIRDLMQHREPLYLEVADLVVDSSRRNARAVGREIYRRINSDAAGQGGSTVSQQ